MTIRPATVADQFAIAELNALVQQLHHDVAPEWFKPPEMEAIVDYFGQALRSDALHAFVVEADGAVRGYALARLQTQPETALTYGGLVVELDQISVEPAYRGRGLGRQLIDQVRSLASDVGAVRLQLTVWEFNWHARDVFERAVYGDDEEDGRKLLSQRSPGRRRWRPHTPDVKITGLPAEFPQAPGSTLAAVTSWRIWEACSSV